MSVKFLPLGNTGFSLRVLEPSGHQSLDYWSDVLTTQLIAHGFVTLVASDYVLNLLFWKEMSVINK
jgi:hypothetical protein